MQSGGLETARRYADEHVGLVTPYLGQSHERCLEGPSFYCFFCFFFLHFFLGSNWAETSSW